MTDFGGKLRHAREGRAISLRQIAGRTKISVAALEALERNDVSKLPGGIFTRSFVRSYAAEVGLNPDETVREFLERFGSEPPPEPVVVAHISEEETRFEARRQAAMLTVKIIVAIIIAAAVLLLFVLRNRQAWPFRPRPASQSQAAEPAAERLARQLR
jgi:cytoskeleton protein RodZ